MKITNLRHAYPESAGFIIDRPAGRGDYTFLHFFNRVQLLTADGTVQTEPGACILYPPGMPQYFYSEGPLVHDWIHFTEVCREMPERYGIRPGRVFYPAYGERITAIVLEMETELFAKKERYEELLSLKLCELFLKIGRCEADPPVPGEETKAAFAGLRFSLFSSLEKNRSVSDMAAAVNLSPSRFFAVYRAIYGISPTEDLIRARIGAAKNLLLFTDLSVTQIALRTGYRNLSHFVRQFRDRTGKSPSEYRGAGML